MRDFQFIIVSTIAEMRTLVELRCDFGWNGHISVDPRAIRFTGLEIRRIAGKKRLISATIGLILVLFFISIFKAFVVAKLVL